MLNNSHNNCHRNYTNGIFLQICSDQLIDLCVLQDTCHELFCVFGVFYSPGTQNTEHTNFTLEQYYFRGATSRDRLDHCSGLAIKYVVIALLKETIALNFALYFVKINILSEERKRECFFVEFGSN